MTNNEYDLADLVGDIESIVSELKYNYPTQSSGEIWDTSTAAFAAGVHRACNRVLATTRGLVPDESH